MACGTGFYRRAQHTHGVHGLMVAAGVVLCYLHWLELFYPCLLGNLVLALVGIVLKVSHIGDVTHVPYLIS